MAASTGVHSYSTTLGCDPAGTTTFVAVAEVLEMNGPGMKIPAKMRTNLNSPNGAQEKVPGLIDMGQLTLKCNFTQAQYAIFLTWVRKAGMNFKLTYPLVGAQVTAATLVGLGQLGELGQAVPEDDVITNDITIEASGLWVFTPGS